MNSLSQRILASIENHGRCSFTGLCGMYPQETTEAVKTAVLEQVEAGWLKLTYQTVDVGPTKRVKVEKNVSRTSKQYYSQPDLF